MKHKVKVVMLPTEDKSVIMSCYDKYPEQQYLQYSKEKGLGYVLDDVIFQHVYITVSQDAEPIKEDYYILWENKVYKYKEFMKMKTPVYTDFYKIIATTDPELTIILDDDCSLCDNERKLVTSTTISRFKSCECIKPLPQIQQSFLKEFVANPDGEWKVDYEALCVTTGTECSGKINKECYRMCSEFMLKLNQDNTINITSVVTCAHPFKRLHWVGNNVFCNACKTTLTKNS